MMSASAKKTARKEQILLAAIILIAALFRLAFIGWGAPNAEHRWSYIVDESTYLLQLGEMDPARGDFVAESFNPRIAPGYSYALGAAFLAAKTIGFIEIENSSAFFTTHPEMLTRIHLIGRTMTAFFALAGVALLYVIGRRFFGPACGLAAAAALAVWPGHVQFSRYMLADVPASTLYLAAIFFALAYLESPSRKRLVGAAFFGALAVCFKNSMLVFVAPLGLAFLLAPEKKLARAALFGALFAMLVAAFTPALLMPAKMKSDSEFVSRVLVKFAVDPIVVLRDHLYWATGAGFLCAVFIGIVPSVASKRKDALVVAFSALSGLFFLLVIGQTRTQLYLPFFAAGSLVIGIAVECTKGLRRMGSMVLLGLGIVQAALWNGAFLSQLRSEPLQDEAGRWIGENVPEKMRIGFVQWYFIPHLPVDRYEMVRIADTASETAPPDFVILADYDLNAYSEKLTDYSIVNSWRRVPGFLGVSYDPPFGTDLRFTFSSQYLFKRKEEPRLP